jgi:hypothetical protein
MFRWTGQFQGGIKSITGDGVDTARGLMVTPFNPARMLCLFPVIARRMHAPSTKIYPDQSRRGVTRLVEAPDR